MKIPKMIIDLIIKAQELQTLYNDVLEEINRWDIDNDCEHIEVKGDNSTNLSEAIQCYINYGENFSFDGFDMYKEAEKRRKKNGKQNS